MATKKGTTTKKTNYYRNRKKSGIFSYKTVTEKVFENRKNKIKRATSLFDEDFNSKFFQASESKKKQKQKVFSNQNLNSKESNSRLKKIEEVLGNNKNQLLNLSKTNKNKNNNNEEDIKDNKNKGQNKNKEEKLNKLIKLAESKNNSGTFERNNYFKVKKNNTEQNFLISDHSKGNSKYSKEVYISSSNSNKNLNSDNNNINSDEREKIKNKIENIERSLSIKYSEIEEDDIPKSNI